MSTVKKKINLSFRSLFYNRQVMHTLSYILNRKIRLDLYASTDIYRSLAAAPSAINYNVIKKQINHIKVVIHPIKKLSLRFVF